jgi:hypothetical protein
MSSRISAAALALTAGLASHAHAQCTGFSVTQSTGAAIVPGTTDIGNHSDDNGTPLPLPFPVTLYGTTYNAANANPNGNLQFVTNLTTWTNTCIPAAPMNVCMMPHWDDLRTNIANGNNGTLGIFTSITGTAPNRVFNVEWRTIYRGTTNNLNFQIRLFEDGSKFEYIYGQGIQLGASATIGIQHTQLPSTQFSCNQPVLSPGLKLTFTCTNNPIPPGGTGSASPSSVFACNSGGSTILSVLASPGFAPPSTGLGVTGDLTSIGGSSTQAFYDDGTHGDATPNDLRFSFMADIPAGTAIGTKTIPFTVTDAEQRSFNSSLSFNLTPCPTSGPDVYVGDLSDVGTYGTVDVDPSGAVLNVSAFAVGTNACNLGDFPVLWIDHNNTPGYQSNQHPTIAQNMYRLKDGRFEQIGQSWLKHGFTSTNSPFCSTSCVQPPMGGDQLGSNCSDLYSSGLNGSQGSLGPRSQVNPTTGYYPHPFTAPAAEATIGRRLQVFTDDITPALNPNAIYVVDGHYVTADDATFTTGAAPSSNGLNNHSYRLVTPATLTTSSVTFAGNTVRFKSGIEAWKDLDPTVQLSNADYIDRSVNTAGITSRFILGSKVTDNGDGTWRYEYAVYNNNADRCAGQFSVPVAPNAVITNIGFHGVFAHSGEPYPNTAFNPAPWAGAKSGSSVSWSCAPYDPATQGNSSNAIRWGTLYNFRFDANVPPRQAPATIGLFKPATSSSPDTSVTAMAGTPTVGCGTPDFNGDLDFGTDADIEAFFACLSGTCCPTCYPGGSDFNADGDFGTDQDIEAFFRVLAGGAC